jgi:hypothetical protein
MLPVGFAYKLVEGVIADFWQEMRKTTIRVIALQTLVIAAAAEL